MTKQIDGGKIKETFFAPSDELRNLRTVFSSLPYIKTQIGNAVQFRIVLDTNAVLADLMMGAGVSL